MRWKNTIDAYGGIPMLFHWLTAAAFIAAYVIAYYVIWIVDPDTSVKPPLFGLAPNGDRVVPILNIHWMLGISIGFLVVPRLLWRVFGTSPQPLGESRREIIAADVAHWALYALLIVMPLSGYMNTYDPTDFGLFVIPAFKDTSVFAWISSTLGVGWHDVEKPMEAIHRFTGKWVAWPLVVIHVGAALFHHFVRQDAALVRMLLGRATRWRETMP
ncbi:cytochrome b [Ideonella sp.]|uniref:cytochrome b n=1 Tax=Ideonella sp. TaxID=1929293 RepID=UPI002B46BFA1|nr:cytochrome b [Ideonella sp.]HJV71693.1 cytochrome b [Ideonella sp.]